MRAAFVRDWINRECTESACMNSQPAQYYRLASAQSRTLIDSVTVE